MPRSDKEPHEREAKRHIGKELLHGIRDVKAGRHGARHQVAARLMIISRNPKVPRDIPPND